MASPGFGLKDMGGTLVGGAMGAGLGAYLDDENRLRGAAVGGVGGGLMGLLGDASVFEEQRRADAFIDQLERMANSGKGTADDVYDSFTSKMRNAGKTAALRKMGFSPIERSMAVPGLIGGTVGGARGLVSPEESILGGTASGAAAGLGIGLAHHAANNVVDHGIRPGLKMTGDAFTEAAKHRGSQFATWLQSKVK
jgi:hypothetical protein